MTRPSEPGSIQSLIQEINAHLVPRPGAFQIHSFEKPGSTIVRVSFENSDDDYHVKIKRPQARLGSDPEGTKRALEREYESLRALSRIPPSAFAIPRPVFFDRHRMILATSTVPGRPFLKEHSPMKRSLPEPITGLGRDMERAGRALRALHDLDLSLPIVEPGRYAERFHANLASPFLGLSRDMVEALRLYGAHLTERMRERAEIRTCHNDFTAHNLLVGSGSIAVLDLDGLARNRPERDYATLYISLLDMFAHLPAHARRVRGLWERFCRGYGRAVTVEQMHPFVIDELVAHVLELSVRLLEPQPLLRSWYLQRVAATSRKALGSLLPHQTGSSGR